MEAADIIRIAVYLTLCIAFVGCVICAAFPKQSKHQTKQCSIYAHLLGKTVEAKVYEGSKWERMVVVAVSWKGAVAVRPEWDLQTKARWIHKDKVPYRVREIDR